MSWGVRIARKVTTEDGSRQPEKWAACLLGPAYLSRRITGNTMCDARSPP